MKERERELSRVDPKCQNEIVLNTKGQQSLEVVKAESIYQQPGCDEKFPRLYERKKGWERHLSVISFCVAVSTFILSSIRAFCLLPLLSSRGKVDPRDNEPPLRTARDFEQMLISTVFVVSFISNQ